MVEAENPKVSECVVTVIVPQVHINKYNNTNLKVA
jgi:hypothetical protein